MVVVQWKNMIIIIDYFMMVNILMEKDMEMVKNIIILITL